MLDKIFNISKNDEGQTVEATAPETPKTEIAEVEQTAEATVPENSNEEATNDEAPKNDESQVEDSQSEPVETKESSDSADEKEEEVEIAEEDKIPVPETLAEFEGGKVIRILDDNRHTADWYHCKMLDNSTRHVPKNLFKVNK